MTKLKLALINGGPEHFEDVKKDDYVELFEFNFSKDELSDLRRQLTSCFYFHEHQMTKDAYRIVVNLDSSEKSFRKLVQFPVVAGSGILFTHSECERLSTLLFYEKVKTNNELLNELKAAFGRAIKRNYQLVILCDAKAVKE